MVSWNNAFSWEASWWQITMGPEILVFIFLILLCSVQFSSVAQSCPTLCDPMNHSAPDSLRPHESQRARPPCPSPMLRTFSKRFTLLKFYVCSTVQLNISSMLSDHLQNSLICVTETLYPLTSSSPFFSPAPGNHCSTLYQLDYYIPY